MIIFSEKTGSIEGFKTLLNQTTSNPQCKGILILSCDENNYTPENLNTLLTSCKTPLFGGIFPEIIHNTEKWQKGTIMIALPQTPTITIVPSLSDLSKDYTSNLKTSEMDNIKTLFVFMDGFSKRISALIDSLYAIFGLEVNYIGGGAGSLSMIQKPCLFSNQGLLKDSAIITQVSTASGIGVKHGWEKIQGPFRVTESDRNTIKTLDWQPAFEVYKKTVEPHAKKTFTQDNFFSIAKGYPFGISKLDAERIVRDPLQVDADQNLICLGEVPEGSFVDILSGNTDSLVQAAKEARSVAEQQLEPTQNKLTLFMDCISRVLFLENDFEKELNAVKTSDSPLVGALTIGEIANNGQHYLEFYNKTSVVGVFET